MHNSNRKRENYTLQTSPIFKNKMGEEDFFGASHFLNVKMGKYNFI